MRTSASVPTLPLRADVLLGNSLFEELSEAGISEEFLQHHTGCENLADIDFLDLQVDATTGAQQVELVGHMMPNLQQLRMNQSSIQSIRDLGTGLSKLRILWLCRSGLQDLGGITALSGLEELYVSFNDIQEIYHLVTHESLQVLDLEGNLVQDFSEVQSLESVTSLRELNLSLNPVWKCGGVSRERVLQALPQLEVLDDIPRDHVSDEPGPIVLDLELEGEQMGDLTEVKELIAESVGPVGTACSSAVAGAEEEGNALQELLQRAGRTPQSQRHGPEGGSPLGLGGTQRWPAELADACTGLRDPKHEAAEESAALAQLRAGRALLLSASSSRAAGPPPPVQEEPSVDVSFETEPNEQDLVVEGLKRAPRPMPSVLVYRHAATSRGVADRHRPVAGLFPGRRELRTAWSSSGGSSSTSYRPATASSVTSSGMSSRGRCSCDEPSAGSDLTLGEDGAALVGNPLAVARRRRHNAVARNEHPSAEDMDIRNLLRTTQSSFQGIGLAPTSEAFPPRVATPDVRIRSAGGRAETATADAARNRGARPHSRADPDPGGSACPPSYCTGGAEVLLLE